MNEEHKVTLSAKNPEWLVISNRYDYRHQKRIITIEVADQAFVLADKKELSYVIKQELFSPGRTNYVFKEEKRSLWDKVKLSLKIITSK